MNRALTVGVCPDYAEERWPSMDRVAAQLLAAVAAHHAVSIAAQPVRPPFRRRAMKWSPGGVAYSIDRACNRFYDYPRHLKRAVGAHDVYHVIDHSYAHLAWYLPPRRTVVTCHDLDAFRPIVSPAEDRRSLPFRLAARYTLGGLRRAAAVVCDSSAVADEMIERRMVLPERVFVVPLGVGDQFSPIGDREADEWLSRRLPVAADARVVLHVGAAIERKRLDVLLRFFAQVVRRDPAAHLVRVGDPFTAEQLALARSLDLERHVTVLPSIDDRQLAAAYRRASVAVLPSSREGFGFPVLEALRSGTAVVASDVPVLREVGGDAASYCPVADVDAWARTVAELLVRPADLAVRTARCEWASGFTWQRYADRMVRIYAAVAEQRIPEPICVQAPA